MKDAEFNEPTAVALDAARQRGDPAADIVVEQLGREVWLTNAMLRSCRGNDHPLPLALPAAARRFFDQHSRLPVWADRNRLLAAQRWASEHVLPITTVLFHAALPNAYASETGGGVLFSCARSSTDVDRCVNDTVRFVLDVLEVGAFESFGIGIRAAQQVRLAHAAHRQELRARAPELRQLPSNQADLLGTWLAFSVLVVRGMRRLGIAVSAPAADDFFHLWRVAAVLLGIEEPLLPANFEAADALAEHIQTRLLRASAAGRSAMSRLLSRINERALFPGITHYLVRRAAGDHVADLLGVPSVSRFRRAFNRFARLPFAELLPLDMLLPRITPFVGQPLLDGIGLRSVGDRPPGFEERRFGNDARLANGSAVNHDQSRRAEPR